MPKKADSAPEGQRPFDGYVRVSKVGGRSGDGFISPDVQEQAILEWAKRHGHEVVVRPHELNVSGGTMDRPVFNELMERVRNGESGGIVVYKTDRFARSLLGAVTTLAELGKHGAAFASVSEPQLDYSTPAGQAFLHMLFVFAEFVRATIKESWATSARLAIERGIHISPNGFLGLEKDKDGRLQPSAQAPIAIEMFERRGVKKETWAAVARWLSEVAPRESGAHWTAQGVKVLCQKRVYRGEASRYVHQNKDNREPMINRDAHPALVSEELWQAAQSEASSSNRSYKRAQLLSGLVRCAGCRYRMSKVHTPSGKAMYSCRGNYASGKCPDRGSIMIEELDNYVEGVVLAELDTAARFDPDAGDRDEIIAELETAQAELEDFRLDTAARSKLGDEWHHWLDVYLGKVRDAGNKLERLDELRGIAGSEGLARDHYLTLPTDERREVLSGFLDAVFVRRSRGRGRHTTPTPERTRILWRGEGPTDLPRPRVPNVMRPFDFGEADGQAGVVAGKAAS
jgi:site-specific DNA recombinase